MYELTIYGVTNSFFGTKLFEGQASESRSVQLYKDCYSVDRFENNNYLIENTKSLLIGLCCVFGLLFIVAAVLFWQ